MFGFSDALAEFGGQYGVLTAVIALFAQHFLYPEMIKDLGKTLNKHSFEIAKSMNLKDFKNSVEMTVKLDTTWQKYERDGGDTKYIKDVTDSIGIENSLMKITDKKPYFVIVTFKVKVDEHISAEDLKKKLIKAL